MDLSQIVLYVIIPILLSLVGYIRRGDVQRLDKIEDKLDKTLSKEEIRQLLVDKIAPLSEDLAEIRGKIDKVVDRLFDLKN